MTRPRNGSTNRRPYAVTRDGFLIFPYEDRYAYMPYMHTRDFDQRGHHQDMSGNDSAAHVHEDGQNEKEAEKDTFLRVLRRSEDAVMRACIVLNYNAHSR